MSKTIVVVGFGPGVSTAVAERFAAEGFNVGLVARNEERLAAGAQALRAKGAALAAAARGDAGDPSSIRAAIANARSALGPIDVIHWNAYSGGEVGDLLTANPAGAGAIYNVAIVGLVAAIQEALPDLKERKGAVLVTNGAFGDLSAAMDQAAVSTGATGVALANAAKHKLVGLLSARLAQEGVYVGEVTIAGAVKGTAFASGDAGIFGADIAAEFWKLYAARTETYARIS
jgi:NADP-dependent 3-hydroxy acid dehydrogenase YdfG